MSADLYLNHTCNGLDVSEDFFNAHPFRDADEEARFVMKNSGQRFWAIVTRGEVRVHTHAIKRNDQVITIGVRLVRANRLVAPVSNAARAPV